MSKYRGRLIAFAAFVLAGLGLQGDEVAATHYQWSLNTDGREWTIQYYSDGISGKVETYLGEMHFQSLLQNSEGIFQIDELSKKILPMNAGPGMRGRPGEGSEKKERPERAERKVLSMEELPVPVEEKEIDGEKKLSFHFKENDLNVSLEIIEGSGLLPRSFWSQFGVFQEISMPLNGIFHIYKALPTDITLVNTDGDTSKMAFLGKENISIETDFFAIPEGYFMQSRPMRGSGGGGKGQGNKGRRGGEGMGGQGMGRR